MPINLGIDAKNIASGWAPEPQLSAPNIGGLVEAILKNRQYQQEYTHRDIANAIKQYQTQQESAAYTDALQKAGLLPEGDYGGLGIKGGASLATIIQRQQALKALEAHRSAMEARIGGGRGRGGGGSGGGTPEPETRWDAQGREWRPGPGGRWIPVKPISPQTSGTPKLSPTEKGWAAPEIPGVSVDVNAPDDPGKFLPPDTSPMPGPPSVPPLLQRPPDASPTPPPADSAAGHAPTYGVAPSREAAAPGQAYRAPDGSIRTRGND